MLRREKLTYSEGRSLAEDYVNKKMMGNENPCCILSIQQLQSNFNEIGFKNTMVNDLAPYMRPALENILEYYLLNYCFYVEILLNVNTVHVIFHRHCTFHLCLLFSLNLVPAMY